MLPALLKWIGNKQRFAETIVSAMPAVFNNYYEPFLGSGAVLGELLKSRRDGLFPQFKGAYASDSLPFLIEIFLVVKDNPDQLIAYYTDEINAYYSDPEKKYYEIRDRFNNDKNPFDFCLLSRICYSGVIRFRKTDGYMSTPRGPHIPIKPLEFEKRVRLWSSLIQDVSFSSESFVNSMERALKDDIVYCDPPYTHSQTIIYGAQEFSIDVLWKKIEECKERGAMVILSLNGTRESKKKDISVVIPSNLFKREAVIDCGVSMIDRLQNSGGQMIQEDVHDKLLFTW